MDALDFIVDRDQHMRPLEYDLSENFNALLMYMQDMGVLDNVPVGTTSESEVVSISDAYPAPPRALNVYGKSTQAGTPTPDVPVPILSVDEITAHASADSGTTDYTNWPVSDLLPEGTSLHSLPDSTKDTLSLSYLRPSTRAGWAWYSRELVQNVGHIADLGALAWSRVSSSSFTLQSERIGTMRKRSGKTTVMCPEYAPQNSGIALNDLQIKAQNNYDRIWIRNDAYDALTPADFKASLSGVPAIYPLATPVTTQLDPIELPQLPAPNATIWCDGGSAQPTLMLEYVRDTNATIAELSEAIADIVSG